MLLCLFQEEHFGSTPSNETLEGSVDTSQHRIRDEIWDVYAWGTKATLVSTGDCSFFPHTLCGIVYGTQHIR